MSWLIVFGALAFFIIEHRRTYMKQHTYLREKLDKALLEGDQDAIDFYIQRLSHLH